VRPGNVCACVLAHILVAKNNLIVTKIEIKLLYKLMWLAGQAADNSRWSRQGWTVSGCTAEKTGQLWTWSP